MSLRTRMLAGLLGLSLAGMVAVGGGTFVALRSFLIARVDQQLVNARSSVFHLIESPNAPTGSEIDARLLRRFGSTDVFVQVRNAAGKVEATAQSGPSDEPSPAPRLAATLHPPAATAASETSSKGVLRFDTDSVSDSDSYRVQVSSLPDGKGILVIAVSLDSVNVTLTGLVEIEAVIALVVLGLLAIGAFWLLRAGLRPLEQIAETAGGIVDGELDVRVAPSDTHSEIGRLGLALNEMLARLQAAFVRRDRSEEQLRRFVANASHELRTPLTSIRGYAALFRRGAQDNPADLAKAMTRIESEATRMGVLIDELLVLARLDEARQPERSRVDLSAIVLDAVQDARVRDPRRPITVGSPGPLMVLGDEQQLHQVAANLLANAQVHTPPRTPVHVALVARGEQAVLTVRDEGPGLDPEETHRIFERFYRAKTGGAATVSSASGGSGLGLSIVSAIVKAHGGGVVAHSTPGQGATFEITLALAQAPTPPTDGQPPMPGAVGAAFS